MLVPQEYILKAISRFCPSSASSSASSASSSASASYYYLLLQRGSARLGRVNNENTKLWWSQKNLYADAHSCIAVCSLNRRADLIVTSVVKVANGVTNSLHLSFYGGKMRILFLKDEPAHNSQCRLRHCSKQIIVQQDTNQIPKWGKETFNS